MKKLFVIQNEVARLFISKETDQAIGAAGPFIEGLGDEINVLSSKLDTTIWKDYFHGEIDSEKAGREPVWSRWMRGEFCPRIFTVSS